MLAVLPIIPSSHLVLRTYEHNVKFMLLHTYQSANVTCNRSDHFAVYYIAFGMTERRKFQDLDLGRRSCLPGMLHYESW